MFNHKVLQKLKKLDIRTITNAVKEAEKANSFNITLPVEPPYYFIKAKVNQTKLNELIHHKKTIGCITVDGIAYLIVYYKCVDSEKLKAWLDNNNKVIQYELPINSSQHLDVIHKKKPDKSTEENQTFSVFETSSIFDDLTKLFDELPNTYYPQDKPYIYLYERTFEREVFASEKFFKLFCTLSLIAQKSNIVRQEDNTCHISIKDLTAIIPPYFKRQSPKPDKSSEDAEPKKKRIYQKAYIKFLDTACESGMIHNYNLLDDNFIQVVFSDHFKDDQLKPPYIKFPFELVNRITQYNYKFLMYFILREFHNNPSYACNVNIKLKDLLKGTDISTHDGLETAANRVNSYIDILKEFKAIRNDDIYIEPEDIHANKPLSVRLFHFRINTNNILEVGELEEIEEVEEPKPEKSTTKKRIKPTEAFLRACKEIDEKKI